MIGPYTVMETDGPHISKVGLSLYILKVVLGPYTQHMISPVSLAGTLNVQSAEICWHFLSVPMYKLAGMFQA